VQLSPKMQPVVCPCQAYPRINTLTYLAHS